MSTNINECAQEQTSMRNLRESGVALLTALLILMLMSSLLVGFSLLLMTDQRLNGIDRDQTQAFYGAEAGMEKLTADLGTLFDANYAPSGAQINALTTKPPSIPGVTYVGPNSTPGYQITFQADGLGNPVSQNRTILSGSFQGLLGELTRYTMTVTSHTLNGSEVKLQRTVQTVGIPVFQFGIFSETDLSFFAGPDFNFGGRVHTNGNLFLAEGSGKTLTMQDRVTALKEVVRTNLSNGWPTNTNYTGTVNAITAPGNYRSLASSEGSLVGTLGTALNDPTWHNLSIGTYNGNVRNGRTGAKQLKMPLVILGGQTIDLIRRPVQNEDTNNPGVLGERYYSQASMKILLSDDKNDIKNLPCIDTTVDPVDLSTLAVPVASLPAWYTAAPKIPLAASGAASATSPYNSSDGYWIKKDQPIIAGFIKIEIQTNYGVPCGTSKDVTKEVLNLGIAGRNLYPLPASLGLPPLPVSQVPPSTCPDPSPNAVIRLERVRDNPSNAGPGGCGPVPTSPTDYWPNVLFDPREGNPRDTVPAAPNNVRPTLGGVMHYVELDLNNLGRWLTGAIGTSGTQAKDVTNATHDFLIYFSDRRTNYTAAALPTWPPASPTAKETGEYGFQDFVNPASQFACPNSTLDAGEDLDGLGTSVPLQTYGQAPVLSVLPNTNLIPGVTGVALTANPNCAVTAPSSIWPGTFLTQAQDARENPPLLFRRALKLVNGSSISLGTCPGSVPCGLNITSENPVYAQGDFNAAGGSFSGPHVAAAVVADSFTFLSNNWNDINSFKSPYSPGGRNAATTWYRVAVVAGKGISFPQPTGYSTYQDFGTDGGAHNFLRYVENWGGTTLNYRGSVVSLYYTRQGTGVYKCCNTVYSPPTRGYNFDTDFLTPNLLPPRTPMFRDVNATGFTQLIMPGQ